MGKKKRKIKETRSLKHGYFTLHILNAAYNGEEIKDALRIVPFSFWKFKDGRLTDCFVLEIIDILKGHYNSLNNTEKREFKDSKLLKEMARRESVCVKNITKTLSDLRKYYFSKSDKKPPKKYLKWLKWLNGENAARKYIAAYWILRFYEALPPENRTNVLDYFIAKATEEKEKASAELMVYVEWNHKIPSLPIKKAGGGLFTGTC
ncbi:MAG: hypothetical protein PHD51_01495 [Patescibacteria group bacterium]|nr:hypothetical protein [Patescibacteria group bacterium]MDD5490464.1 hypothetical protein [Patescibacteria group bacterium]